MSAIIPAELPNIADARLPATYESAKQALAECSRIDECQNWADKAAALASYARQARDDTLFNFAMRIKARALDRCGELLRRIPASPGGRPETKDVVDLSLSPRQQAAHDAQLSERQRKTALRINNIPLESFEALVESEKPPTATQLAEMGKKKRQLRDLGDRSPEQFAAATALTELIQDFVRESASVDIPLALHGCEKAQLERRCGDDASDLVGRAERISGGEVAGQRDIQVFVEPEGAVTATGPERLAFVEALAKLPVEKQGSVAGAAKTGGQVNAATEFSACDPEASKTSDGTGKESDPAPALDPQAWSRSTATERQAFVKAVGRSEIEDAFHAIETGCGSTRGLNALNQSWKEATESDRREFYRRLFPANVWNRFQT